MRVAAQPVSPPMVDTSTGSAGKRVSMAVLSYTVCSLMMVPQTKQWPTRWERLKEAFP
jgi:hypothetical protein